MFSNIDLYLNNKLVTSNTDTYPYKAYIENLFSYAEDIKLKQLKAGELWDEDEAFKFENFDSGLEKTCAKLTAEGKSVEAMGRLHLDLAMQEKYLPNGIELKLFLNQASPQFCLMVGEENPYLVVVKIDTATLSVRPVQLLPAIANDLNQSIARHNAKFPIRRVEVKTFTIGAGMR